MQTGKYAANVGSRLKLAWKPGRRHLKSQPSSRIGENSPYGMIGGIEETSASSEARSAPRSYPTTATRLAAASSQKLVNSVAGMACQYPIRIRRMPENEQTNRRLAAVLAADVVGYSRMMSV